MLLRELEIAQNDGPGCPAVPYRNGAVSVSHQPVYQVGMRLTDISRKPTPSPLTCDLAQRSHLLFSDLEGIPLPSTKSSAAEGQDQASGAYLLRELAAIAEVPGAAEPVFRRFAPLALDIVARWLEDLPSQEGWEARLAVLASLAEPRPDLWRYVPTPRVPLTLA